MGEVDIAVIAQRLNNLRKHLGERLGEKLTLDDVAAKAGIEDYKMVRLEQGKGSWDSLISLLLFYRTQGYNLDWILFPDNSKIPMMLSSNDDVLVISELIKKLSNRLQQDYSDLTAHLTKLGYSPLEDKQFDGPRAEEPLVFDFSS